MHIRFTHATAEGHYHILAGEHLDLPDAIAQKHLDEANAVRVPAAEHAVRLPGYEVAVLPRVPAKKSAAKKAAGGK